MLVSDIISRVRQIAGDINSNQFTDTLLISWINDGVRECVSENQFLQVRATTQTDMGTSDYNLPADILKLYSVTINNQKIDIKTLQEFQRASFDGTETGLPIYGYIWASKLTIWPNPDQQYSLEIDYIKDPTDLTLVSDTPILPSTYHIRLVDYCLAQVAAQDDDQALYSAKMDEFHTGVKKLQDQAETQEDVYPSVSVSPRDMGDGALEVWDY